MHTNTSYSSGNTISPEPITIEALQALIKKLKLDEEPKWVVLDPHGTVHMGTLEQMFRLLASELPSSKPNALKGMQT